MARPCPVCGIFEKDGWEIENLANEPRNDDFPAQFEKLIALQIKQEGNQVAALQCPACGLVYEYRKSTPGGSRDAMNTWVVESLSPMMKHGKHLRKNIPPQQKKAEEIREFLCPACGSDDINCVNAGIIGGEVFISLKCRQCGNDDTLDEYQLISWRRPGNQNI